MQVCELDLIFHADSVHHILNELVLGGMVLQTNMNEILARIEEQNKIVKSEAGISAAGASKAMSTLKNFPQIKDKVRDLPNSIRDFKFWPRAMAIEGQVSLDSTNLTAFKMVQSDGGYSELQGDLKK